MQSGAETIILVRYMRKIVYRGGNFQRARYVLNTEIAGAAAASAQAWGCYPAFARLKTVGGPQQMPLQEQE
jgi:hypothetical protein